MSSIYLPKHKIGVPKVSMEDYFKTRSGRFCFFNLFKYIVIYRLDYAIIQFGANVL